MVDPNGTLLRSLTGILQQAAAPPTPQAPAISQAQAATALAELVAGLAQALGNAANQAQPQASPPSRASPAPAPATKPSWNSTPPAPVLEPGGPLPTVEEFVAQNCLEPWVIDCMYLLRDDQRDHVMKTPLNLDNTTNLNGVITSRIKEVAPVEQRLQLFIQLNGLAEGVVDRLGTLTPDQHEKVMESTLKIQKANNPSGVCMRRITDVLRNDRLGIPHGPHMSSPQYRDSPGTLPPPRQQSFGQQENSAASLLSTLVSSLTGVVDGGARDRSRSRPPVTASASSVPKDIQGFLDEYSLDWWVGEVLARLSLWQRQNVMTELENMRGVRNPSGVVMARVKQVANTQELLTIFIDLNKLDVQVADELWALTEEQQIAIMAPGIYIQNARSPSVAARSRIRQVLAGNDAMGGARRGGGDHIPSRSNYDAAPASGA